MIHLYYDIMAMMFTSIYVPLAILTYAMYSMITLVELGHKFIVLIHSNYTHMLELNTNRLIRFFLLLQADIQIYKDRNYDVHF
jgi:hypothetical protein